MTETRWWRYIQRLTDGDTAQEAARRAGFDKSAFTRWKKGARADPDFCLLDGCVRRPPTWRQCVGGAMAWR